MKSKSDTFIFLWGGPLKSPALSQVLYWAVNEDGEVGGIVLPSSVWAMVEKALLSAEKDQVDSSGNLAGSVSFVVASITFVTTWQGKITVSGTALSMQGTWTSLYGSGTFSGTGTSSK